jgi:hypothetical protein
MLTLRAKTLAASSESHLEKAIARALLPPLFQGGRVPVAIFHPTNSTGGTMSTITDLPSRTFAIFFRKLIITSTFLFLLD